MGRGSPMVMMADKPRGEDAPTAVWLSRCQCSSYSMLSFFFKKENTDASEAFIPLSSKITNGVIPKNGFA